MAKNILFTYAYTLNMAARIRGFETYNDRSENEWSRTHTHEKNNALKL